MDQIVDYIRHRHLAMAAVLAWVFSLLGFVLDLTTSVPHSVIVAFYVAAYVFGGTTAAIEAGKDLLNRKINVDLLMVLAAIGAAALGQWLEGAILLSLFSTSNALEYYTMDRTRSAVKSLMDLTPPTARVERDGQLCEISVDDVVIGDRVVIQPGERIPVDARIVAGASAVDQAAITGESQPVSLKAGDSVYAGTINGNGVLHTEVTKLSTDTTLARIVRLVSDARSDQSDLQEFAEGFEGKYAAGVILVSLLVGIVPILFGAEPQPTIYRAMTLLVVLSPCALVISTPAATLSALANAARNRVLVKGGRAMDLLGSVSTIAFDKTGTLTIGKPMLTDIVTFGGRNSGELLQQTAAVEVLSEHPMALAVVTAAEKDGLELLMAENAEAIPGHGISAMVNGSSFVIGNRRLMDSREIHLSDVAEQHLHRLGDEGKSTMLVARNNELVGILAVADVIRPGAQEVVKHLKASGVEKVVMLSGDNARVANAIGKSVGMDEVHADLLPEDKVDAIRTLAADGKIAMVGDGVNDAPALAVADVGIAMGAGGTDAALETADVVLMTDDIERIGYAIGLSRKMRRIVKMNLTFALSVIAVLATLTLTVGIPLPVGVIGHEGSTVIVILNGLRLLGYGGGFRQLLRRDRDESVSTEVEYRVVMA